MKVWEKNRPLREGCLRKLCEKDIEMADLAINPKVADQINLADAAGFNVPVERPKNRENRWKLIEKKREMALVEEMLRIKNSKIEELMTENEMKQIGLICSEQMLQEDTRSFLDYFAQIKETTAKASQELEKLKKERNDKTMHLRVINDDCSTINSKMNKNLETLAIFHEYKEFLDNLRSAEEKQHEQELKETKRKSKEEARKAQNEKPGYNRRGANRQNAQKEEEDLCPPNCPPKLRPLFLEDDEDEDYKVPFENHEDLMHIFGDLEEQNLKLIQQGQEIEQAYENKLKDFERMKV